MSGDAAHIQAVRDTAYATEKARLIASRGARGWLTIIVPIMGFLMLLQLFTLQKATGIPFFYVLGFKGPPAKRTCKDGDKDCVDEEGPRYSSESKTLAKIVVGVFTVGVLYFLYDVFSKGPAQGLIGGEAASVSPSLDTRQALTTASVQSLQATDMAVAQQSATMNNLKPAISPAATMTAPTYSPGTTPTTTYSPGTTPTATTSSPTMTSSKDLQLQAAKAIGSDFVPSSSSSSAGGMMNRELVMN